MYWYSQRKGKTDCRKQSAGMPEIRQVENFVSGQDAPFYARMYQSRGICGGHIILLNAKDSPYYEETKNQRWQLCVPIRGDCRSAEELPMPMRPNFWKLAHLQWLWLRLFSGTDGLTMIVWTGWNRPWERNIWYLICRADTGQMQKNRAIIL